MLEFAIFLHWSNSCVLKTFLNSPEPSHSSLSAFMFPTEPSLISPILTWQWSNVPKSSSSVFQVTKGPDGYIDKKVNIALVHITRTEILNGHAKTE